MPASQRDIPLDDRVPLVQVRIFFGHASGNMAAVIIGAILVAVILYDGGVEPGTLGAWGLLLAGASARVSLFERHVARVGITAENCRRLVLARASVTAATSRKRCGER